MQDEMHITEAQAVYLEKFLNFRGNIAELAAAMGIPLVDMIDILSAPAVQKRIKAAAKLTKLRRKMIVADIEITALETLEQVAANKYADVVERRRAAAAILRALHKPKRRRSSKTLPPSQNRARQEAAVGQTTHHTHTSNTIDSDLQSPSDPPSVPSPDPANYCPDEFLNELREARQNAPASNITVSQDDFTELVDSEVLHPQDETTKLLEETTEALIELDELCAQEASSDASEVEMHSDQAVPTSHPGPGGANDSCHGWSADEVETEPVEGSQNKFAPLGGEGQAKRTQSKDAFHSPQHTNHNKPNFTNPTIQNAPIPTPDQTLDDYDPETGLTTPLNNHTSKPQQNNHKTPYPEKDNPWESHPFARAGRSSNHDPP